MRRRDGDAKSIRGMLRGSKFVIDYYQREYRWEGKQVAELLGDLAEKCCQRASAEARLR